MSFSYKGIAKKCTSLSTELLLKACEQTDNGTYIYPPLDKRYSHIISSICGPNKENIKNSRLEALAGGFSFYFISFSISFNYLFDEKMKMNNFKC